MLRNYITWWNNLLPLSKDEFETVNTVLYHKKEDARFIEEGDIVFNNVPQIVSNEEFLSIKKQYFDLLPESNCYENDYDINFGVSGTYFINNLFEVHVDENTLIISSDCEHPSVKKQLQDRENVLILSQRDDIRTYNLNKVKEAIKGYKKVFIYIIGVRNDTGEITPQRFFIQLHDLLETLSIPHITVLDDVQGMFISHRDYSIFDYILGTAHAILSPFDMGILISKKYLAGIKPYNWTTAHLNGLRIFLRRMYKLNIFKTLLTEYFYDKVLTRNYTFSQELSVPYIFHIKTDNVFVSQELAKELELKLNLLIPAKDVSKNSCIQMRANRFILQPSYIEKAVTITDYILDNYGKDSFSEKEIEGIMYE